MPIDINLMARFRKPPKTGPDIRAAFGKPPPPKVPIVEEFLYRRKLTYLIADPGTGKSTIATQVTCSVAGAKPLFGLFDVPLAVPVYYVSFETEWEEFMESCSMIDKEFKYDPDLIKFDDEMLGINVLDADHARCLTEKIAATKPGLIIIDPIYLLVAGDLKEGSVASSTARWMNLLATQCNAAVLPLHHTHKERSVEKGQQPERDRSYGSRWLKASATLWWQMTEAPTNDGVVIEKLKDRYKLSRNKITLKYDPSTKCSMGQTGGKQYLVDRVVSFVNAWAPGVEITIQQMADHADCSSNYIYELIKGPVLKDRLERVVKPDRTVVWRILKKPVHVGEPAPADPVAPPTTTVTK